MKIVSEKGNKPRVTHCTRTACDFPYTLRRIFLCVCQCFLVPAGPIPGAGSDGEPLKGWMIAVIVSLAGLILLGILVLVFYFFKLRKNEHRGKYKTVQAVVIKKLDTIGYF